ncbi:hypothetical protein JYU34_014053 [Plutella xylostella]|uniref:Transposase n=1 Tax=Plutella xylostella TaxID=51655 RepID=A0ABQ7Q7U3_PLUXY|nr:hypothetical protein JYU34_014053 [Plutella xylostella]
MGVFNTHNEHVWSHANPRAFRETGFQHRWRINVWAGIIGDHLIGPVFLPHALNGANYLGFLRGQLEELLEDLPVAAYHRVVFQHDGAPAHFAVQVRNYLAARFPQWIGRGGVIPWPPRSPDLTPLDFFLWGHVKTTVYAVECGTEEQMRQRIVDAFAGIDPPMIRRVVDSVRRRTRLCIQQQGRHIEPFL